MRRIRLLTAALLIVPFLLVGCDPPKTTTAPKPDGPGQQPHEHDHDHGPGPHGGTVVELDKYHGEFVVDHAKKQVTFYILSGNLKKNVPIAAEKLTLNIKSPKFDAELKASPQEGDPAGKASRFVAVHDNFGKEQEFEGTVSFVVDGVPFSGDFKEKPHDHDHKDGKKK